VKNLPTLSSQGNVSGPPHTGRAECEPSTAGSNPTFRSQARLRQKFGLFADRCGAPLVRSAEQEICRYGYVSSMLLQPPVISVGRHKPHDWKLQAAPTVDEFRHPNRIPRCPKTATPPLISAVRSLDCIARAPSTPVATCSDDLSPVHGVDKLRPTRYEVRPTAVVAMPSASSR